jgi:hypothetical protein
VDPESIRTRAEFHAALQALRKADGRAYLQLAGLSGLRTSTIHDMVTGKSFPHWSTLEPVLRVWGLTSADLRMWERARARVIAEEASHLGRLLTEVDDPFELEVHRPIVVDDSVGLAVLPPYVRRAHDDQLDWVVRQAAGGVSGVAVLVAGSSAGKTRALWEALTPLRNAGRWRLWHPIDPTRRDAVQSLGQVRPYTVVWLNETQVYLGGDSRSDGDEQIATALRNLLSDLRRAPVLVLGTLWREHHASLCCDPASPVSKLLDGAVIEVPESFAGDDLDAVRQAADRDPRLGVAFNRAADGRITQYLAGGPELIKQYRFSSSPAAIAVVDVAMDALRMGHRNVLSYALLHDAASVYMIDSVWNRLDETWLEQALAENSQPCKGAEGPVTAIRPRPTLGRASRATSGAVPGHAPVVQDEPAYRLADYLAQYGRAQRARVIPPTGFWAAAALHSTPDDQAVLGRAAWNRGLYREAAQLWKTAAGHGHLVAATDLVRHLHHLFPADTRPASWVVAAVTLEPLANVVRLVNTLRETGAVEHVAMLVARIRDESSLTSPNGATKLLEILAAGDFKAEMAARTADEVALTSPYGVGRLLETLCAIEADDPAAVLAGRATTQVSLDNSGGVANLLEVLNAIGAPDPAMRLAARSADNVSLDSAGGVASVLATLLRMGADDLASILAARAAGQVRLDRVGGAASLLKLLLRMGADGPAAALAARAADRAPLDSLGGIAKLLAMLLRMGADELVTRLATRTAEQPPIDNLTSVPYLISVLLRAGKDDLAVTLLAHIADQLPNDRGFGFSRYSNYFWPGYRRTLRTSHPTDAFVPLVVDRARVGNPQSAADLLGMQLNLMKKPRRLQKAEPDPQEDRQMVTLAAYAADYAPLENVRGVVRLVWTLRAVGASKYASMLATRAAEHAYLNDSRSAASLLEVLNDMGADGLTAAVAARAVGQTVLDDARGVAWLLDELHGMKADETVATLAARAVDECALDDSDALAYLLEVLNKIGADGPAAALAARAAGQITLDDPSACRRLLEVLSAIRADRSLALLLDRLPAAGLFDLFIGAGDEQGQFPYGRQPDTTRAEPWTWSDLMTE